jgi:hypothetical protein
MTHFEIKASMAKLLEAHVGRAKAIERAQGCKRIAFIPEDLSQLLVQRFNSRTKYWIRRGILVPVDEMVKRRKTRIPINVREKPPASWLFWVLIKPREVIGHVVATNPRFMVLPLAASTGAGTFLMQSPMRMIFYGRSIQIDPAFAAMWGALFGVVSLYFFGWFYRWVGSWLDGTAKTVEVRAAVAWAKVPTLLFLTIWVIMVFVSDGELLKPQSDGLDVGGASSSGPFADMLALACIWSLFLASATVGEVHHFPTSKGLGTIVSAHFILMPIVVVGLLAGASACSHLPVVQKQEAQRSEEIVISQLGILAQALEVFRTYNGAYPSDLETLVEHNYITRPLGELVKYRQIGTYRLRYQKLSQDEFLLEASNKMPTPWSAEVIAIDQSGKLVFDGSVRDEPSTVTGP